VPTDVSSRTTIVFSLAEPHWFGIFIGGTYFLRSQTMDPNQTFIDMFQAMKDEDHPTARDLAFALKCWFAKDGFYPSRYSREATDIYIASILRRTAADRNPDPPFSLVCYECDAGEGIVTEEEAMEEGWTEIELARHQPQANFIGFCPECGRRQNG
jgi:hypothetical protein